MQNKELYSQFCISERSLPIFLQPWWLDVVSGKNQWEVSLAFGEDRSVIGAMPFMREKKGFLHLLRMPPLTPFLGVWLKPYPGEKLHGQYSYEKKIMERLIEGIPKFHYFAQRFSPSITNWYPFYLKGFSQTTSYTYIIPDISDQNVVWEGMKNTVRTAIRKAETILSIKESTDIDQHLRLQKKTFKRQELDMPFAENIPRDLFREAKDRNQGTLLLAVDQNGITHASCFLVWDRLAAYNLMIGTDTEMRSSGAVQLLLWEAIKISSRHVTTFNFEGSMLPHVEPVFRHFGGVQTPYFRIFKDSNKMVKMVRTMLGR